MSDHCPLLLTLVDSNFGPKPFKWFNSRLDREDCEEVVIEALHKQVDDGPSDIRIQKKLFAVRVALRGWWKVVQEKEKEVLNLLRNEIASSERRMEESSLEEEEMWVWEESKKEVEKMLISINKDLHQKSRVKWASMGDDNSAFFHRCMNGRKAANSIPGLLVDGKWVSKPPLVKKEVLRFFRNHFHEAFASRPVLLCDNLKQVPSNRIAELVAPFSKEEIKEAVFDCGADKAPGPDGFNFRFIKHFWEFLEDDFLKMFEEFHETGVISKECSTSFITLIAKTKTPVGLKDYRPINLVGVISKSISKVIAGRIKRVIGEVIFESQYAFLKERFILDGPLVLNELIGWIKKYGKKAFLMKIDFEKAYDNVSWDFLLSILDQMGFPMKWRLWVKGILQSTRSSILVNGSPTFEFQCQKGLRQGDPLSPFLFLIVMEALSCLIAKACSLGEFEGISLSNEGPMLSHMLYVDDALIMGGWSKANVLKTNRLLRVFYLCSGLRINIHKSLIFGLGVDGKVVGEMAAILGCKVGTLPFEYLGILVGANMNRISHWDSVLDTVRNRLQSWKSKLLSIGETYSY
ncbi:putative RNA-directed DNA polymerase [Helianthus annuus]|nr:putative RNA-directed DNA polymerase [Helianthus annuus]